MAGFEKQTYTQVPNSLFEIMGDMDACELKVVLYVCRYTFGYHRERATISTRKMAKAIGMSVNSVIRGAELAEKRGLLRRVTDGQNSTEWCAIVESDSTIDTVSNKGVSTIDTVVYQPLIQGDSIVDTQVRLNKDKEKINLHTTIEKANKTMDALLANERKAVGKEYSNFPETFIPYARAFQTATGIKPTSKEKMDWLSTIQDWINAGYQPDDVTAAVKAIVSDGRMAINRPGSITWKLRDLKIHKVATQNDYQPLPDDNAAYVLPPRMVTI